jgi:3-oxoadipate enol-lactonase
MQAQINDFRMAYEDRGQGIPLLLIHGYPLNRRMWQPQLEGLADVARVIAPDLRGHGESQAMSGPYPMDLLAGDVNALLDVLNIHQPLVLCGLSMGGYVAMAFCRQYASRLKGLILTATRTAPDSSEGKERRDAAAGLARQEGVAAIVETMLPRMMSPVTYQNKLALVGTVKEIMLETSLPGVMGDLMGMKERPDSTPSLAEIDLPVLILHGADDPLVPLQEAQAMQVALRNAQLEVLPEAGHLPNLEQPEKFNQAVRRFLASLKEKY